MRSFCVIMALGAVAGCMVEDKLAAPDEPGDGGATDTGTGTGSGTGSGSGSGSGETGTPPGLNLVLVVVDRDGKVVVGDTFDARDDVYFSFSIIDPTKPVVAEDYAFQILSSRDGALLSDDKFACRLFHVNVRGMIDSVQSAGGDCAHDQRRGSDGRMLVRAMPFDMPETNGNSNAKLTLKACNLAECGADAPFTTELVAPFEIDR